MKVSVIFEDHSKCGQILKRSSSQDSSTFKKLLKESFREAWDWLIPGSERRLSHSAIQIEVMNVPPDGQQFIARYDYSNSFPRFSQYKFKAYLTKLIESLPDKSQAFEWMKTIWVHEITHLLDSKEIISYDDEFESFMKQKEFSFPDSLNDGHWILLSYLHSIRDEGIAVTVEKLFDLDFRQLLPEEDARGRFQEDMKAIAEIAGKLQYQTSDEQLNEYAAFISGNAQLTVYMIAPWLLIKAMIRTNPQCDLFSQILECLQTGKANELSPADIREFIRHARAFEFLDFIRALECDDIMYQSALEACSRYYNNYPVTFQFFSDLRKIREQKDTGRFRSLMSEIIGSPMNQEALINGLKKVNIATLPGPFLQQLRKLEVLAGKGDPDAIWGLSYFLHKIDLLDDSIHYLGYLDDYHVISTAFELNHSGYTPL